MGQSPTWQDSTKPFRQFNSGAVWCNILQHVLLGNLLVHDLCCSVTQSCATLCDPMDCSMLHLDTPKHILF